MPAISGSAASIASASSPNGLTPAALGQRVRHQHVQALHPIRHTAAGERRPQRLDGVPLGQIGLVGAPVRLGQVRILRQPGASCRASPRRTPAGSPPPSAPDASGSTASGTGCRRAAAARSSPRRVHRWGSGRRSPAHRGGAGRVAVPPPPGRRDQPPGAGGRWWRRGWRRQHRSRSRRRRRRRGRFRRRCGAARAVRGVGDGVPQRGVPGIRAGLDLVSADRWRPAAAAPRWQLHLIRNVAGLDEARAARGPGRRCTTGSASLAFWLSNSAIWERSAVSLAASCFISVRCAK